MERNFGWHARYTTDFHHRRGYNGYRGRYHRNRFERPINDDREENYRDDFSGHSQSSFGMRGKPYGSKRGKHPPGLKGKAIGLWYSQQGSLKNPKKLPSLAMDQDEASSLNEAIDDLSGPQKPLCESKTKSFKSYEGDGRHASVEFDSFDNSGSDSDHRGKKRAGSFDGSRLLSKSEDSNFNNSYKANIEANKFREQEGISGLINKFSHNLKKNTELDQVLFEDLLDKENKPRYRDMLKFRRKLPSYKMKHEILELIKENQVIVLSGETGCGKTTQVAQFVLDELINMKKGSTCRIICTQPRRISAIAVAKRVADERIEKLGKSVGYQIRLESVLPRSQGSILYCTTGIVLQWLHSDPLLSSISHLVIDEIHERDSFSDFLLCISKDLLPLRPDLKVILMSATLNAEQFSKYFGNCPMIHIPGFTYEVKEYFLEDVLKFTGFKYPAAQFKKYSSAVNSSKEEKQRREYDEYIAPHLRKLEDSKSYPQHVISELYKPNSEELNLDLILSLLKHINKKPPGAVLVFLPGWEHISKLHKMIQDDHSFNSASHLVIPLHSLMPTTSQQTVFDRPPQGVRKIVIATNIAETSITIDDVVYVIDGGLIKMKAYDKETNISTLLPEWVTMANAKQRRGRAGRVQEGICYHLYTKAREMLLDAYPLPEIQRIRLEEVILQVKILRLGFCKTFLQKIMDPPDEGVVDASLKMLHAINALDKDENLTPLGFHLARLPMDPLTGKMLLMGSIFSCLGPILTVAASLSFKDPFVMVLGSEKLVDRCRLEHARGTKSDHLMLVNVFNEWQMAKGNDAHQFVRNNFLSSSILHQLKNMRGQFMQYLKENKFVKRSDPDDPEVNLNSDNITLVKAIITAGLYPNVARILKKHAGRNKGQLKSFALPDIKRAMLHPKSVNGMERNYEGSWMVYWEKIKTTQVFLYDTTMVSNYPLLLFGQGLEYDERQQIIDVDGFVKVKCDKQVADVMQKLRKELDNLLEYKISHPATTDWSKSSKEVKLISLIIELLNNEEGNPNEIEIGERYSIQDEYEED